MSKTRPPFPRRPPAPGRLALCLALALCLSPAASVQARETGPRPDGRGANAERRDDIGPARAAEIARERHGGKVLKVERDGDAWRVRLLLPSGRVRNVRVDAGE